MGDLKLKFDYDTCKWLIMRGTNKLRGFDKKSVADWYIKWLRGNNNR